MMTSRRWRSGMYTSVGFTAGDFSILADTTAHARTPLRLSTAVARGLRESAVIALAVAALVLLTALASYHPQDPGFSLARESTSVHNRIGPIGAWIADLAFFLFGQPAFLFPVMLAVAGLTLYRRRDADRSPSRANTAIRVAGFVLLLIA